MTGLPSRREHFSLTGFTGVSSSKVTKEQKVDFDADWDKTLKAHRNVYVEAFAEYKAGRKSSAFLLYSYRKHKDVWDNANKGGRARENLDNLKKQGMNILKSQFEKPADPTMQDLVKVIRERCRIKVCEETGLEEPTILFKGGDWVEIMDDDMQWRLHQVKEVKAKDEDKDGRVSDWEVLYNIGGQVDLPHEKIRCSEAGLKHLYGVRPFIWQQYALLKLEDRIRFQKDHADDFVNFDHIQYVTDLWNSWLDSPDNKDFKEIYENNGESGKKMLEIHIMSPFYLIRDLATDEENEWNVEDDDVVQEFGAFTYLSFIGDGFVTPFIILLLQIAIPSLIIAGNLLYYVWKNNAWNDIHDITANEFFVTARCVSSPTDSYEVLLISGFMAFMIQVLYFIQVTPASITSFYLQVGNAGMDVFQKMKSLRMRIRDKKHDRVGQNIGYTLDLVMNTLYVIALYMANIFNVIQTEDSFEMLLNCLALIFVAQIDEEFSESPWYDPGRRWLRSSCVELVFQYYIDKPALCSTQLFSLKYGINLKHLNELANKDPRLFKNRDVAYADSRDLSIMSHDERVRFMSSELALLTKNPGAVAQYCKERQFFSVSEYNLVYIPFVNFLRIFDKNARPSGGVFNRYELYRCWSRWNDILFIGPLPVSKGNGGKFGDEDDKTIDGSDEYPTDASENTGDFPDDWNYDPEFSSSYSYFWTVTFIETLLFKELSSKIVISIKEGRFMDIFFWIYDAVFEWLSFFFHVVFPLYCLWGILIFPQCIHNLDPNQKESEYESGWV